MEKLTDAEVKRALKCCIAKENCEEISCEKCPLERCSDCKEVLFQKVLDLTNRQKEEKEHLEYVLMAVMHSVDKWLEGDELKQDEANRACTMREKTLKITEKLQKKIDGLNAENLKLREQIKKGDNIFEAAMLNAEAEKDNLKQVIERLKKSRDDLYEEMSERQKEEVKIARKMGKSEAYRECVERVKQVFGGNNVFETCVRLIADSILNELTQNLHGTCTEGGNEDG